VIYQSPSTYLSRVIAKVKVFGGWQNYRMSDRSKTICHPIFNLEGIKTLFAAASS
jgi:hypothetical protein